jgi:hypothetical protein
VGDLTGPERGWRIWVSGGPDRTREGMEDLVSGSDPGRQLNSFSCGILVRLASDLTGGC